MQKNEKVLRRGDVSASIKNMHVRYQTMPNWNNFQKHINLGFLTIACSAALVFTVPKVYRSQAEVHHCDKAEVQTIDTTFNQYHEESMPNKAYRIMTDAVDYPIDVPAKIWDTTIEEGDTVSIDYRKDFPLWGKEFDGISIANHE